MERQFVGNYGYVNYSWYGGPGFGGYPAYIGFPEYIGYDGYTVYTKRPKHPIIFVPLIGTFHSGEF